MFLISSVSALEFDNVKSYDEVKNEITFKNSILGIPFLELDTIAVAKLDTPQVNYVMEGKDRRVAEITINSYENYETFIKGMELINLNTGKPITREVNYKYRETYFVDVNDYQEVCELLTDINGTKYDSCKKSIIGTHKEERYNWIPLEKLDLKIENLTIGIYTDVYSGDNIEWYPTLFGLKITEWATWTASFNVGLLHGFQMDNITNCILTNSVNISADSSIHCGANFNTSTGMIINGTEFQQHPGDASWNNSRALMPTGNNSWSVSFWIRETSFATSLHIMDWGQPHYYAGLNGIMIGHRVADHMGVIVSTGTTPAEYDSFLTANVWEMYSMTYNGTHINLYRNGTWEKNSSVLNLNISNYANGYGNITFNGKVVSSNLEGFRGALDEVYFWNRALTSTEVTDLWNDGAGISYINSFATAPTINMTYPLNQSYNEIITAMNYTFTNDTDSTCKYSLNSGANTTINCGTNVTGLSSNAGSNEWCVSINNTSGNATSCVMFYSNIGITIKQSSPIDYYNTTDDTLDIVCNFTSIGENIDSVELKVYDSLNNLDYTNTESGLSVDTYNKTWTTTALVDGIYNWSCYGYGSAGVDALTGNRTFTIDKTKPVVSIVYPTATSYTTNISELNFTATDTNPGSCWYSTNLGVTNSSEIGNFTANFTTITSVEGSNTWILYCNDTVGNLDNSSVVFTKDSIKPTIDFVTPTIANNTNLTRRNIIINVTSTDTNLANITINLYNISRNLINSSYSTTSPKYINFSVTSDGTYYFNATAYDTYMNINSTVTYNITVDTIAPNISIVNPIANLGYIILPYNLTINYIATDLSGLDTCWYNIDNGANVTFTSCRNSSKVLSTIGTTNTINIFANDTLNNIGNASKIFTYTYAQNNITYNANTVSGTQETFKINLNSVNYPSLPYLNYNGTLHLGTITSLGGTNYLLTSTFNVPIVGANTTFTFYWNVTNSVGVSLLTNATNQTVEEFKVDDCSVNDNEIFNFTLYDEDTQIQISETNDNTTIKLNFGIYSNNGSNLIMSYNDSFVNRSSVRICMSPNSTSHYIKGLVEFESENYIHEFYYLSNYSLENAPFKVKLYDLLVTESQEFLLTYKDSNFLPAPNILVLVTRNYIDEDMFKTVEILKTDTNGQVLPHLVLGDVIYTFIFMDYTTNEVLSTLTNYVPFCDNVASGQCYIYANALQSRATLTDYETLGGVYFGQSFNSTNRSITTTFTSLSGTSNVQVNVTKYDRFGNNTICSDTLNSPSGSMTCNIPVTYGDVILETTTYSNGVLISTTAYALTDDPSTIYQGYTGILFTILIIITITMIFVSSPMGIVVAAVVGLIISGLLGLLVMGPLFGIGSILIWAIVAGAFLIYKVNKVESQ